MHTTCNNCRGLQFLRNILNQERLSALAMPSIKQQLVLNVVVINEECIKENAEELNYKLE